MPDLLLPWLASSVPVARRSLSEYLRSRGLPEGVVADSLLVLSELLSNSLRHAEQLEGLQLSWELRAGDVRISVTDGGGEHAPAPRQAGPQDSGGRGVRIVAEVSCDWGVSTSAGRQTVWATVPGVDSPHRDERAQRQTG